MIETTVWGREKVEIYAAKNNYVKNVKIIKNKKPAIAVRKSGAVAHLTPQNDQLMSECHVLCLKPALRLEWRDQDGQDEAEQCKHYALTLGDTLS